MSSQPTAGLNTINNNNTTNNNNINGGNATKRVAAASIPRNTSPSRLPKPGVPTITTRKRAGTTGSAIGDAPTTANPPAAAVTTTRSTSGIFGRLNSVAARKPVVPGPANDQAEPSKTTPATTRPTAIKTTRLTRPASKSTSAPSKLSPASSKLSPTNSTRPSASETISPKTATTKSTHTRAKSSATSLTTATVLRPPRPPSAGSIAASTSTTTAPTTATAASRKPPARSNTVTTRSATTTTTAAAAAATQRQVSGPSSTNKSAAAALGRSSSTITRPTGAAPADDNAPPRPRPTFSTFQQHYSPARSPAPKPPTSSYLAPPTPSRLPANIAISSETARLQAELLQLHLLHRGADAVAAAWHASAREKLGDRFAELAGAAAEVGREEAEAEEERNLAALVAWGGGGGGGLEDRVQVLDGILSGVWSLGEPGGRYARAVRKFERWAERMVWSAEARRKAGGLGALMGDDTVAFVGELDPVWKDEVASMTRKLDLWRRQLRQLGGGLVPGGGGDEGQQQPSSLVRILAGCRDQVDGMLAELDIMGQIERDALAQETAWVRRMNRDDDEADTPRAGAIWRAF
ncbi:hypothetical protein SLS53_005422 [Cytospora paraplurivora]|uniref:Uncharacterized protein n=1 Tax=Cytospora paraplurivora TaxID=2898453 RepID=A0AAN9U609_9PEZI